LQSRALTAPDGSVVTFAVDTLRREALLHGLDDIGLTLKDDALIREWQQADRSRRPWAWPAAAA
ncbi:MAG: 3-isopropylmalate dehydratase small subunit, partial [Comamonadaceae bacterium]